VFERQLGFHNLSHEAPKWGLNIVEIESLRFGLTITAFESNSNVIAIRAFGDPL
jgi:hypothetical protein